MRVLVIGGTRFFGLDAVRLLVEHGADVTVLSSRPLPADTAARVTVLAGDRNDPAVLAALGARAAKGVFDAVWDNIAMTAADVSGLLGALQGRLGRYLMTSTGSVYLTFDFHRPLSEEDARLQEPEPPGCPAYASGKRAAERELARHAGLSWSVLRPTIVMGPGDPTTRLEFYVKRLLEGKPVGPTGFIFNPVYSMDVARLAVRMLETPPASGSVYNVAGRETVSVADLCIRVEGILRIPPPGHDLPGQADQESGMPGSGRFVLSIERALQELRFDPTPLGSWLELTAGKIQQRLDAARRR